MMFGLSIVGKCTNLEDPGIAALVMGGSYDEDLLCMFYGLQRNCVPGENSAEYTNDPDAKQGLQNLKDYILGLVQEVFRRAQLEDQEMQALKLQQVRHEVLQSSKPHEMGTVNEIAQKYGISKSEVRRRKADGTLHELAQKA